MALHRAIIQGRTQQVKYLLGTRNNAINSKDNKAKTPLILTCEIDDNKVATSIARLLLKSGAQVGIVDGKGRNALSHACMRRRQELVKLFLTEVDYDLNMLDFDGNTPLHHAAITGDLDIITEMVRVYKRNHSSVDVPNKLGETPLMIVSKLGFLACAEVLITTGLASLTKRDNVNFMNALEWAQTNKANKNINLSSIYCSPNQNNSSRSNSALDEPIVGEETASNCDTNEAEDENTKSMAKCLANAYRIYQVQNSNSYRRSSITPVRTTPAILTSFFDFQKDGTYSIEDVMWLVSKTKVTHRKPIPKTKNLIRRHTDSRLSSHSLPKSPRPSNASVLDSLSIDHVSRLHGIQSNSVRGMDSDTSDSDSDAEDDVFFNYDSDDIHSFETNGKKNHRPKYRYRAPSNRERHDSGIPESTAADSSDEQVNEQIHPSICSDKQVNKRTRPNTCSDRFLTTPATKQRLVPFTNINILKAMKSPETTKRLTKSTDEIFLRPDSSPLRQYRANSDSAIDTKSFISHSGSAKAPSSPSIARWQNAVREIRHKIQNNVRFNLESRNTTSNNRPQTGTSTRTSSAPTRKDHVSRRNSEGNRYSTHRILPDHDQEFTRHPQSILGRKTRSRYKKITLDSPGSTTTGYKQKKETRREWKRQQEIESEKRRNDLNRKIDSLRSDLVKIDARWRARKYHPQANDNMFKSSKIELERSNRKTPGAQSEEELVSPDALQKTQRSNSSVDVRFNATDSRMSWATKCPTDSSLTSSVSLPSLGWSSSSEDLLRSVECDKEAITCSEEMKKIQKQERKQRLRQISSIRRPAQAPPQIVADSLRKLDNTRFGKVGFTDTKTLKIMVPGRNARGRGASSPWSYKRNDGQFQQHP